MPDPGTAPNVRAVSRVSIEFLLRCIDSIAVTAQGDLLKGLIFTAIWTANVRHLINSSSNLAYGSFNDIPPDALRRPVSVLCISNSLQLPYETTRRYAETLVREGTCVRVAGRGLIVPAAVHLRPINVEEIAKSLSYLRRYTSELRRVGVDVDPFRPPIPIRAPAPDQFPANIRALLRVGVEFLLRSIELFAETSGNDFVSGVIFTAIWTANVMHITNSQTNTAYGGIDDIPPDELRRPVSVLALANSLNLPYETVRRYANKLVRDGLCLRIGKEGLIVPRPVFEQPRFKDAVASFDPRVSRFLGDLKRVGYDFGA
jgi:hypothetical protein